MSDDERTQRVKTIHGEITYPTVECTSCGETVHKDRAYAYFVGEVRKRNYYSALRKVNIKFDADTFRDGHLCPYCADAGPMALPSPPLRYQITNWRVVCALLIASVAFIAGAILL